MENKTNIDENQEILNTPAEITKPYVMRNFKKELKRVRWPIQKKHNKNFLYIFVFVLVLTGFFALVSLGATQLIEIMGAK